MAYTDGEIRQYIRDVVREAKRTSNIDTGFLRRSIKGALIGKDKSIEFEQIEYGAYNNNSDLINIAKRIIPSDLKWILTFINEDGEKTKVVGKSRTGRTIVRSQITSDTVDSPKIKEFIKSTNSGKTDNNGGEGSESQD